MKLVLRIRVLVPALMLGCSAIAAAQAPRPATTRGATPAPSPSSLRASSGLLDAQVDGLVRELLAKAPPGAKGLTRLRYDGVGWEAQRGTIAGTSLLGIRLDTEVQRSLGHQGVKFATSPEAGSKGIGAATVLRGAFRALKSGMSLTLSLLDAQSGQVISTARRMLDPSQIAAQAISADPPESANARLLARFIQQTLGAAPPAFALHVTTDRGANAGYVEGDRLHVLVDADRDCYLRVYHVSWNAKVLTLVFPNRSEKDSFLPAGTLRRIPDDGSAATFEVSKPYGVDALIAIASEQPFPDDAWVTAQLDTGDAPQADPSAGTAPSVAYGETPEANDAPSAGDGSRGVHRSGPYLAMTRWTEARAKGVLAKGLLVRHADAATVAGVASTESPVATEPSAPGSSDPAPVAPVELGSPPVGATTPGSLARAVCYFTTLPRLRTP